MRFVKKIKASTIGVSLTLWAYFKVGFAYLNYPLRILQKALKGLLVFQRPIQTKSLRRRILKSRGKDISEKTKQEMALGKSNSTGFILGYCNICGIRTAFLYHNSDSMRESLICNNCHSISRYRSLARGLLQAIHHLTGIETQNISHLPLVHNSSLAIYDTQPSIFRLGATYALPDLLSRCKWIRVECSVYRPNMQFGRRLKANLSNQNIEALTFPDSSFDIVITSDVMEHVRLDDQAHREIQRVLKPGGIYIFTVPSYRQGETLYRVLVTNPANPDQDQFLTEKEFHDDPNIIGKKSLVYRIYGTDLDKKLEELGFGVHYECLNYPEYGILDTELFLCELKNKPRNPIH